MNTTCTDWFSFSQGCVESVGMQFEGYAWVIVVVDDGVGKFAVYNTYKMGLSTLPRSTSAFIINNDACSFLSFTGKCLDAWICL